MCVSDRFDVLLGVPALNQLVSLLELNLVCLPYVLAHIATGACLLTSALTRNVSQDGY